VTTAAQQIESARASVRLQERNLDAEQKRYENGMSTSFRITEIQEDLTQARSRQVSAVTAYRRALASYYRAIGSLLEENGVELAGPVEVELPRQSVFSLFR
jgi:outer membrane protein TolC